MRFPSLRISLLVAAFFCGLSAIPTPTFAACAGQTVNPNGTCVVGSCSAEETNLGPCTLQDSGSIGQCCLSGPASDVCNVPAISSSGTCKSTCGEGEQSWGSCSTPSGGSGQCCIGNSVTSCKGKDEGVEVEGFCQKSCDPTKDINVGSCAGGVCCYPRSHKEQANQGKAGYFNTYGYNPPLGQISIPQLVARFISQVLPLIGALFFLMFLWGGFQWFTAGGEDSKVKGARATLVNAAIGITIVILSYSLVSYLLTVFSAGLAK